MQTQFADADVLSVGKAFSFPPGRCVGGADSANPVRNGADWELEFWFGLVLLWFVWEIAAKSHSEFFCVENHDLEVTSHHLAQPA